MHILRVIPVNNNNSNNTLNFHVVTAVVSGESWRVTVTVAVTVSRRDGLVAPQRRPREHVPRARVREQHSEQHGARVENGGEGGAEGEADLEQHSNTQRHE